jgi:hypothetical protein
LIHEEPIQKGKEWKKHNKNKRSISRFIFLLPTISITIIIIFRSYIIKHLKYLQSYIYIYIYISYHSSCTQHWYDILFSRAYFCKAKIITFLGKSSLIQKRMLRLYVQMQDLCVNCNLYVSIFQNVVLFYFIKVAQNISSYLYIDRLISDSYIQKINLFR